MLLTLLTPLSIIKILAAFISGLAAVGMFINGIKLMFDPYDPKNPRPTLSRYYKGVGSFLVFTTVWIIALMLLFVFGAFNGNNIGLL